MSGKYQLRPNSICLVSGNLKNCKGWQGIFVFISKCIKICIKLIKKIYRCLRKFLEMQHFFGLTVV